MTLFYNTKFAQGVRRQACLAPIAHNQLNLKITRVLWILSYFIRINVAFPQRIDDVASLDEARVESKSANELLIFCIYNSNKDISEEWQAVIKSILTTKLGDISNQFLNIDYHFILLF